MSDNATAPPPAGPPPVGGLFGPLLVGVCVNCILYGILVLQVVIYYVSYKKDPKWIRYFVLYLFVVETINIGCNIATIYEPLVIRYATPAALTFFPIMITATPTTNVAISTPVQMFTAWRIVVITKNKIIGLIICTFSLLSLAFAIYTATIITTVRTYAKKDATITPATVWFVAAACADSLITATLYFSLSRRRTGFRSTDQAINRIIRLTLQTGLLTLLFAISETVSFILSPGTTANFALDFPLSKLYTNALLSTLNARLSWRKLSNADSDDRTGDDDNVLFGRQDDSRGQNSRPSTTNRPPRHRSQRLRHDDANTTSISFNNSYELESRIQTTDLRTLGEEASDINKDYGIRPIDGDVVANRNVVGVQIQKESQVVRDEEYATRYSPHPYAHGTQ